MSEPQKVVLLGATGSIGASVLKVIRAHGDKLQLLAASANSNSEKLMAIAEEFGITDLCLSLSAKSTQTYPDKMNVRTGSNGLEELSALPEADTVVVAIVGSTALQPTLAAIRAGKKVVLANKECLVLGGKFVMEALSRSKSTLIPADSEHNAVFQCLEGAAEKEFSRIILTASGGPFRDMTSKEMEQVTPERALRHPNWSMGPKITVDSATMANKGLELIEAKWLFDAPPEKLEVVVHRESIVHSLVRFKDGCILAQLSPPSMTFALQHALLYPNRSNGVEESLDFSKPLDLSFEPPDFSKFACLRLAREALRAGGAAPAIFNAANETAVEAFLRKRIGFLQIGCIIEDVLNKMEIHEPDSLGDVLAADEEARSISEELINSL